MAFDLPFSPILQGAPSPFQLFIGASTLFFVFYVEQRIRHGRQLHLPPGPRPLPVVGNLFDIPKAFSARKYRELSNQYGDIVHLHAFGQHIIVLGSLEAATELLDTRSAKYSGRPHSAMSELIKLDQTVPLLTYGETWRKQRREIHKFFSVAAAARWNGVQESGARKLLALLLEDPQHFSEHVELYVRCFYRCTLPCHTLILSTTSAFGSTSLRVTYGISPKDQHDEALAFAVEGAAIVAQALVPGKYLVESIPILKYIPPWFPGAGFQRDAARWRRTWSIVRSKAFDDSIAAMVNDTLSVHQECASILSLDSVAVLFSTPWLLPWSEKPRPKVRYHLKTTISRGTFRPRYILAEPILYVVIIKWRCPLLAHWTVEDYVHNPDLPPRHALNPEAQKRAHIELDAVIGPDRLPSLSDRGSLPYIEALMMECHRWHPILPLSLVRTYTGEEDDEYNGYRIPKGSLVLAISWAFAHDPQNYPEPETFMPERYLTGEGELNHDVRDPRTFTFGYGRRVCPGKHFGDTAVWITVACVLHTFNIEPPLNEKGETVVPNPKFKEGVLSAPEDFQCRITPRSAQAEALIRQNPA